MWSWCECAWRGQGECDWRHFFRCCAWKWKRKKRFSTFYSGIHSVTLAPNKLKVKIWIWDKISIFARSTSRLFIQIVKRRKKNPSEELGAYRICPVRGMPRTEKKNCVIESLKSELIYTCSNTSAFPATASRIHYIAKRTECNCHWRMVSLLLCINRIIMSYVM